MSGPFATASELAEYTGLTLPTDLARWQACLDGASALIRGFTDQTLSVVSGDVVVLPPVDRIVLILPERPVSAITSVVVDGVTLASTDYWFASGSGLLYSGSLASPGTNWSSGATVTYTHGFAETTDDFKLFRQLCMDVAARALLQNQNDASLSLGGLAMETVGFAPSMFLTDGEKMRLASYGMVLVG